MDNEFSIILTLIIPRVIELIKEHYKLDEITATKEFYQSEVYSLLEDERSKVWHFSPRTLFQMYKVAREYGHFTIPEEAG